MDTRIHLTALTLCGAVLLILSLSAPVFLYATGTDADKQCTPFFRECECGMKPNPDKRQGQPKCIRGENKHSCICTDRTNKLTTTGTCVSDGVCKGISAGGLDGKTHGLVDPKNTPWSAYSGAGIGASMGEFGSFGSDPANLSDSEGFSEGSNAALDADPGESWEPPPQNDPESVPVTRSVDDGLRGLANDQDSLLNPKPLSEQNGFVAAPNTSNASVLSPDSLTENPNALSGSGDTPRAAENTFDANKTDAEAGNSSCSGWWCGASDALSKYDPFKESTPSQDATEPLRAESNGKVNPVDLYETAREEFREALKENGGSWPKATIDAFRKIGVTDVTDPDQLAKAAVMLARTESGFKASLVSAYDAARGLNSEGLYQLNNLGGDARYGIERGDATNPQKSVEGLVEIAQQGQLNNYFGPIKRGGESVLSNEGWFQANVAPYIQKAPDVWSGVSYASYTPSAELNNFGMYNTGLGTSEYSSLGSSLGSHPFEDANTWTSSNQSAPAPGIDIPAEPGYTYSSPGLDIPAEPGYAAPASPAPGMNIPAEPGYAAPAAPAPGIDIPTEPGYADINDVAGNAPVGTVERADLPSVQPSLWERTTGALSSTWDGIREWWKGGDVLGGAPVGSVTSGDLPDVPADIPDIPAEPGYASPPAPAPGIDIPAEPGYAAPTTPAPGLDIPAEPGYAAPASPAPGMNIPAEPGYAAPAAPAPGIDIPTEPGYADINDVASNAPVGTVERADLPPPQQSWVEWAGEKYDGFKQAVGKWADDASGWFNETLLGRGQAELTVVSPEVTARGAFSETISDMQPTPFPNTAGNVPVSGGEELSQGNAVPPTALSGETPTAPTVVSQEAPASSVTTPGQAPTTYDPRDQYYNDVPPNAPQNEEVPLPKPRPPEAPAAPATPSPTAPAAAPAQEESFWKRMTKQFDLGDLSYIAGKQQTPVPPPTTPPASPGTGNQDPGTGSQQGSGSSMGSGNSGFSGILGSLSQMLGQMLGQLLGNKNQNQQSTGQTTPTTPTTTTPTTPTIQAIASLIADPSRTTTGNSVRLVWASVGTVGCAVKDGVGAQISSGSADGFVRTEALATTTSFTLSCVTSVGGSVSASTTVIVSPAATTTTATTTSGQ